MMSDKVPTCDELREYARKGYYADGQLAEIPSHKVYAVADELDALAEDRDTQQAVAMDMVRYNATLRAKNDALAATLAEAPHASYHDGCGVYVGEPCNCWKSKLATDALTALKEAVWDEVLDVIEENELNTGQARQGNPYRVDRETVDD